MKKIINLSNFKKALKSVIALILTIMLELVSITFIVQLISGFYQVAINHQLNVFDLTILSTFTGATCGVIVSKIASIYRFFKKFLDKKFLDRKKGESDDK